MADDHKRPDGLLYIPGFVPPERCTELFASLCAASEWTPVNPDNANSRQVIQYGWAYPYRRGDPVVRAPPIPPELRFDDLPLFAAPPDQVIVNKYEPREGIAAHVDDPALFGPAIASLTLGSACEVEFTRPGFAPYRLYVVPGSLYVMSGDARYVWRHGIRPRLTDPVDGTRRPRGTRISLTYRTMHRRHVSK